ncbi:dTDP-4-dehydrorhamnose reductase [Chitinophaga sp. YR627]|uniref:SDR family oxidoreductase n=1 Tax=Chitinophaga sp. YR627 TaxID=1881041 RepID=UPI0008E69B22|nr:SDR family oxidoreductase [Chitinophaga sp. YR627]SFN91761.1 dTDP-4-dehydrorhamnose reductase [Chitinophaga sp. YR627]
MKVFIVGASGLIGSHCMQHFQAAGADVVGTHRSFATPSTVYFDPGDDSSWEVLKQFAPDIIIHCGAMTNADYCESNVAESEELTVVSVKKLCDYCRESGCKFVYISTDYIFDGQAGPYREDTIPNPLNVYGRHKLAAEQLVQQLDDYLIARVTNVYGEELRNKNFISRLVGWLTSDEEREANIPYDQFATPLYAGDVGGMLVLLMRDKKQGVYNFASTDYFSRYQLARKVCSYFPEHTGLTLHAISTAELKQAANRPLKGGLNNQKFSLEYPEYLYTNIDSYLLKIRRNGV